MNEEARRQSVWTGACAFLLVFSAMMIWTATGPRMRVPWYDPPTHEWIRSTAPPTHVAMDYYARLALALAVGAGAGLAAGVSASRRAISATLLRAFGVWALLATLAGMFLYSYSLLTRNITPPPPDEIPSVGRGEP